MLPAFGMVAGPTAKLKWDASPEAGVNIYRIYRSTTPITATSTNVTVVSVTNVLTATITNMNYSTTYYFRATAVLGNLESDFSNEAIYTTPKLPAPTNLGIEP